jgi:hypothetical protein
VVHIPTTIESNLLDAALFRRFRDLLTDLTRGRSLSANLLVRLDVAEPLRRSGGQRAPLGIVYNLRIYVLRALENTQARSLGIATYLLSHPAVTPMPLSSFSLARIHITDPE